jgi:hypothetical protein
MLRRSSGKTYPISDEQKRRKTSSVRHTRAIQRDRSKHPSGPTPDEEVQSQLEGLIQPKLYTARMFADLGLRQLILTLPLILAFVLSLIWREIGSVSEAVCELNRRGLLWSEATAGRVAAFGQLSGLVVSPSADLCAGLSLSLPFCVRLPGW